MSTLEVGRAPGFEKTSGPDANSILLRPQGLDDGSILLKPQGNGVVVFEPKYPFHRLAILNNPDQATDSDGYPLRAGDGLSMTDSSMSLRPVVSYSTTAHSESSSVHGTPRLSSLMGIDSRRSLQPSSSIGSQADNDPGRIFRSTQNLSDQPIAEEAVSVASGSVPRKSSSNAAIPDISSWNSFEDADFSTHSQAGRTSSASTGRLVDAPSIPKEKRRFSIAEPFSHLRMCKKKRACAQCRWDIFPGIRMADANRPKVMTSQPATSAALQEAALRRGALDKTSQEPSSPTGPLSVISSGTDTNSRMERELARTFDLQDLEASENSLPESSSDWNLTSQSASQDRSQASKAATAPAGPPRQAEPQLPRSTTAPELSLDTPSAVKDTGKLHVERFKGIVFVNEYALVRTLGKGSFGKVKLALNTHDHELYALKLIPKSRRKRKSVEGSPQIAEAAVMQEINVMKSLSHPNIVRLAEVIDDPQSSKMLMVLEYVEGGSIFSLSGTKMPSKKRLTELAARKYFRDVLQGLDYLHANQVAHGDLKPDNLLLGANGHVKIADFGSSQLTRVCDLVNRTAGTPAFMAPEMCSGQPYHARLADVWALGVCLYMFIYGTVPFKSDSIIGLYDTICKAPLKFPEHIFVSNSLKHLLLRLLDKDPENRISLTGAMNHHWVTHNGAYPLPNIQGLEPDEEEDPDSLLLECWPDDPADIGLESVLKTISPLFEQRLYPDGALLAAQGDPARCIFFVEEGYTEIYHTMRHYDSAGTDTEDETDDEDSPDENARRHRLKREGSMLKTMFCATVRASRLVSAVRDYAGGERALLATRGPGSFIGEVQVYEKGIEAVWQTCVKARGTAKVLVLYYKDLKELVRKRPEAESDIKAVMAQRKGELLKMEMLERLAGLHRDLREEVQMASEAGGASASAIAVAKDLLGCADANSKPLEGQALDFRAHTMCTGGHQPPEAVTHTSRSNSPPLRVEQSRESFEAKGDSAKVLSLHSGGKSGGVQEGHRSPSELPASPVATPELVAP